MAANSYGQNEASIGSHLIGNLTEAQVMQFLSTAKLMGNQMSSLTYLLSSHPSLLSVSERQSLKFMGEALKTNLRGLTLVLKDAEDALEGQNKIGPNSNT